MAKQTPTQTSKTPTQTPTPLGENEVSIIRATVGAAFASSPAPEKATPYLGGFDLGVSAARAAENATRERVLTTAGRQRGRAVINGLIRREERTFLAALGLCKAPKGGNPPPPGSCPGLGRIQRGIRPSPVSDPPYFNEENR